MIQKLVESLRSDEKKEVHRERQSHKLTGPVKDYAVHLLERSDIPYTCPGRNNRVYRGKENNRKIFRARHYLLWTYRDLLPLLNKELEDEFGEGSGIGYGTFSNFMTMQKCKRPVERTVERTVERIMHCGKNALWE